MEPEENGNQSVQGIKVTDRRIRNAIDKGLRKSIEKHDEYIEIKSKYKELLRKNIIPYEVLEQIKSFDLTSMFEEGIKLNLPELYTVLDEMKRLKNFSIQVDYDSRVTQGCIEHLNSNVENILILEDSYYSGFDFNNCSKFKKLKKLAIYETTEDYFDMIHKDADYLNFNTKITLSDYLEGCTINEAVGDLNNYLPVEITVDAKTIAEKASKYEEAEGRGPVDENDLIGNIEILLKHSEFIKSKGNNVQSIEGFIKLLNKNSNIRSVNMTAQQFDEFNKYEKLRMPVTIPTYSIDTFRRIDLKKLEEFPNLSIVEGDQERNLYYKLRAKADELLKDVQVPPEGTKDREKIIFAQIYAKIGEKYKYDPDVSEAFQKKQNFLAAGKKHDKENHTIYALLSDTTVCDGYAQIIKLLPQIIGIECEWVESKSGTHAFNRVKLDEKWYFADLTWDRDDIVANQCPLRYFLKSAKDFIDCYSHVPNLAQELIDECNESLSDEEQIELFRKVKGIREARRTEAAPLSNIAISGVDRGITTSSMKQIDGIMQSHVRNMHNPKQERSME